jgi:spore maturation protein CgeB
MSEIQINTVSFTYLNRDIELIRNEENNYGQDGFNNQAFLEYVRSIKLRGTYVVYGDFVSEAAIYFSLFCGTRKVLCFESLESEFQNAKSNLSKNDRVGLCLLKSAKEFGDFISSETVEDVCVAFIKHHHYIDHLPAGLGNLLKRFTPALFIKSEAGIHENVIPELTAKGYIASGRDVGDKECTEYLHFENRHKKYFDVSSYWENRYQKGGDSGSGSYGRLAKFKAHFLNQFVANNNIESVVELGCGDGAQVGLANYPSYVGFDISESSINTCNNLYSNDSSKKFLLYDKERFDPTNYVADLALSLDVIFHLSSDESYDAYLSDLFALGKKYVIIYSNSTNLPSQGVNELSEYIRFRDFSSDVHKRFPDWSLIDIEPNYYPYNLSLPQKTSFADFYVFSKGSSKVVDETDWANFYLKKILRQILSGSEQVDVLLKQNSTIQDFFKDLKKKQDNELQEKKQTIDNLLIQLQEKDRKLYELMTALTVKKDELNNLGVKLDDLCDVREIANYNLEVVKEKKNKEIYELKKRLGEAESKLSIVTQEKHNTAEQYKKIRESFSYNFGRKVVNAFYKPGIHTVLLPFALIRDFARALQRVANQRKSVASSKTPVWHKFSVESGCSVEISGAVDYLRRMQNKRTKAIIIVQCFDRTGTKLEGPYDDLPFSEQLQSYFKYLPDTSGHQKLLFSFKPPLAAATVRIGFRGFQQKAGEKVTVNSIDLAMKKDRNRPEFIPPSKKVSEISILGWPKYPDNDKPKVMGVLDEFTTGCIKEDLNLIQPRPDNWYALAEKYRPELFFIESAWKGNYGSWQYRIGDYANKPGQEVAHIAEYAKRNGIPFIFWNKEDPVHHQKFMCSAKLADHIFTTDANMCDSYYKKTGIENVDALPFAAQPTLHKPAPIDARKSKSCFAGSWYSNRHAGRRKEMSWLLKTASQYGLDIYDRNYGTGLFPFPGEYQDCIKGSLAYKDLCKEYRRYRVFLNVNSVSDSPTMFSRRVFELMACGTPIVSTYAKGIEEIFESDAVWLIRNKKEASEAIKTLMNDDVEWRRRSLLGIREVFTKHTYAHRLNYVFNKVGFNKRIEIEPRIILIAKVENEFELSSLIGFTERQSYRNFSLLAVSSIGTESTTPENMKLMNTSELKSNIIRDAVEFIGIVDYKIKYGIHYLQDLVNATRYQPNARGWGKSITNDKFCFKLPLVIEGSLWQYSVFVNHLLDSFLAGSLDEIGISESDFYTIDSHEFEATNNVQQVRGKQ